MWSRWHALFVWADGGEWRITSPSLGNFCMVENGSHIPREVFFLGRDRSSVVYTFRRASLASAQGHGNTAASLHNTAILYFFHLESNSTLSGSLQNKIPTWGLTRLSLFSRPFQLTAVRVLRRVWRTIIALSALAAAQVDVRNELFLLLYFTIFRSSRRDLIRFYGERARSCECFGVASRVLKGAPPDVFSANTC